MENELVVKRLVMAKVSREFHNSTKENFATEK